MRPPVHDENSGSAHMGHAPTPWPTWAVVLVELFALAVASTVALFGVASVSVAGGAMIMHRGIIRRYDLQFIRWLSPAGNATYLDILRAAWAVAVLLVLIGVARLGPPPFRWSRGGWWLLGSILLSIALFALRPDLHMPRIAAMAGFERMSGMNLPRGTLFVEARGYDGWKEQVQARVQMPRSAFVAFVRSGFADSTATPEEKRPWAQLEHLKRHDLGQGQYELYDGWPLPAGDDFLVATADTFYGGDGHCALAIAADRPGGMVEVVLQYTRS